MRVYFGTRIKFQHLFIYWNVNDDDDERMLTSSKTNALNQNVQNQYDLMKIDERNHLNRAVASSISIK